MFKINVQCGLMFFCLLGWPALANTDTEDFVSVCDRTEPVQQAILKAVDKEDCAVVTAQDLRAIEVLNLSDSEINRFKSEDFQGLRWSALADLNISGLEKLKIALSNNKNFYRDKPHLEIILLLDKYPDVISNRELQRMDGELERLIEGIPAEAWEIKTQSLD